MTLINSPLLLGMLLAAVPVLLHMMMRARPKKIEFPALQLLRTRQSSNSRRMRIRHLLLLLLRMVVIAILVTALTRPSLPPARYGLRLWEWLALIGVVVAAYAVYRWLNTRTSETAPHLLRERRGRLRLFSVLGGLLAAVLIVLVPWGLRVRAEVLSPRNEIAQNIPVAAVFLFDTSFSMSYLHENRTRLKHAKEIADSHLSVLPPGSHVAIAENRRESDVVFQADLAGARSRIDDLEHHAVTESLNAVVKRAIEAHLDDQEQVRQQLGTGAVAGDLFSREIYVLTDLSESAWQIPDESGLSDLLLQHDWVQLYIVDVSVANPTNMALSQLRLSEQATVVGRDVILSVTVAATAAAANQQTVVKAFVIGDDGTEIAVGAPALLDFAGSSPQAQFQIPAPDGAGSQMGFVRLESSDPMSMDDIRYFAFGIKPRPAVLMISDRVEESRFLKNVLQPEDLDVMRYDITTIPFSQFSRQALSNYDVVCFMNCRRPDDSTWAALSTYVNNGGSLVVTTGGAKDLDHARWNSSAAEQLLPATPLLKLRFRGDSRYLRIEPFQHPVTHAFETEPEAQTELLRVPFRICWAVEVHPDATTLLSFSGDDHRPALLERRTGSGRTLLFTSAMDYLKSGGRQWNDLPTSWAFLMLSDQMMLYLTGAADQNRNFTTGMPVELSVPAAEQFRSYLVSRPRFRQTDGMLEDSERSILITDADEAGFYRVRSAEESGMFHSEFAMNMPDEESHLDLMTDAGLDEILGAEKYARVTDPEELETAVRVGRLGIEVFPVLMGLLVLVFCAEHLMACFFYDEEPDALRV